MRLRRLTRTVPISRAFIAAIVLLLAAFVIASCKPDQSTTTPPSIQTPITPRQPSDPASSPALPTITEAKVLRVIDGDTIEVSVNGSAYRVRYIGIDTPETVHPSQPIEYIGKEASDKNNELVAGKTVRLERDVSETDRYGRLLRYVYVGDLFINAELVRLGYAEVVTYPPDVKYLGLFLQLQREAKEAGWGLWATPAPASTPTQTPTPTPATAPSLEIVSVTSPASPGDNVTLIAKTFPGAQCTVTVYYKSGPSTAPGLSPEQADANGNVSWTWKIGSGTTPGSWRIVVTANSGGQTVSQTTYFTVR